METKIYTTIDRTAVHWPKGPWDDEPDKKQWQDENTGLPCLAVRHPRSGHWCGYVGITERHPFFMKGYEDVPLEAWYGLTYADFCHPGETEASGICHVPSEGEPDRVWWFGFDCAHCDDYSPQDAMFAETRGGIFRILSGTSYKTLEFVETECEKLAAQLWASA